MEVYEFSKSERPEKDQKHYDAAVTNAITEADESLKAIAVAIESAKRKNSGIITT